MTTLKKNRDISWGGYSLMLAHGVVNENYMRAPAREALGPELTMWAGPDPFVGQVTGSTGAVDPG
jgi:hypothetical protein